MAFTYDVASLAGQVRLLIGDTVSTDPLFQDDEIAAFLDIEEQDIRLAAALALDAMAANQVMVLKVITQNGVSTNGAAVAQALRAQAKTLRDQAEMSSGGSDAEDALFDWAETVGVSDPFARRERIVSQALRGEV